MLESEVLSSFAIRKALVDLTEYGANDVKGDYSEGAWKDVSSGAAVYAIPVDGGPMGMLYRQDIFDEYGIAVPTTWDEFAAAAQQLKDAGAPGVLVDFATNGRAYNQALFAQAGSVPFDYDNANPTEIGIEVNDQGAKDVLAYWETLVDERSVATDNAFTADYNTKLVDGSYAVYVAAACGRATSADCRMPTPTRSGRPRLSRMGHREPRADQLGRFHLRGDEPGEGPRAVGAGRQGDLRHRRAWKIGIEEAALFPLWKPILESDYFRDLEYPFFDGRQINKDVFLPAASGYTGFTFEPVPELRVRPAHRAAVRNGPG